MPRSRCGASIFAATFLGKREAIGPRLVVAAVLVVAGGVLIGDQPLTRGSGRTAAMHEWTCHEISRRVRAGDVSAEEVVAHHLDRIEARGELNAFVTSPASARC